ncbi:glycoside hydrolase family protein [Pontiella desulfatans]|nr:glycoside hydrolase family protein [Pontiella desulfatans]
MKKTKLMLMVFPALLVGLSSGTAQAIEESSFSKSLVPGAFILPSDEESWTWGMAPMYDEAGKLHIFNSVIPNSGRWVENSKIVHWTADSVEGPYTLVGDLFSSDDIGYHNPQISKVGDTYVLVYLYNKHNDENGSMQEVGIATATSLDGPWKESPLNPIIPASGEMNGATINHASNPTFVAAPDGTFRIYYKSMTTKHRLREISMAVSDTLEGPYKNHEGNPVISYADQQLDIEDPYAFYYNGMYYMIVEDRRGVKDMLEGNPLPVNHRKSGGLRPGLIYTSKDGIDWGIPEVGYLTNEIYFGAPLARSERPSILWKDGQPEYLFLACHDKDPTAGYYLKINNWKGR